MHALRISWVYLMTLLRTLYRRGRIAMNLESSNVDLSLSLE